MKHMLLVLVSASLVNNVILSRFLGLCPFLGVSSKLKTSVGMGAAVIFVITIASAVTWVINAFLLIPNGLEYLQTIVFILVIAALVQLVEMVLKKSIPSLYSALGIYLPLITTNCAVLGIALENADDHLGFYASVANGFGAAVGFFIAIVLMAGIRERLEGNDIAGPFKGAPIVFVTAGLMAISFCGFSGLI